MLSLLTLGECMLELQAPRAVGNENENQAAGINGDLVHSFAGDTYNTAVYAKRQVPSLNVGFGSVIGRDPFSIKMRKTCESHELDVSLLSVTDSANLGIYAVTTDSIGEKQFFYWRKGSAATQICTLFEAAEWQDSKVGVIYFSGITLAILTASNRDIFLQSLAEKQKQGARIAFDPNYRARLWESEAVAKQYIEEAYRLSDIAFPGLEDHNTMYGHNSYEEINQFLASFNIPEQIIKCDDQGVYICIDNQLDCHEAFKPAPKQVDTTAAGDSFAGSYLASRLAGESAATSVKNATDVAREVVQHRGAII
ncbi:sugar kinase [Glaciecola petra]|uniref:Sugar kinase n=1 Tax=Glaciecola petra TaxID=3075602 RepID=A0ABU2ZTV6_9ALTE|nr:sugar kinase [Aestuariibacter sp. P117]MDT0596071.1 sugar kinase [Aestuariibacter sp. P117]